LVADLEPWLGIALFLLHERSNPASEWQPYLASMPPQSTSPVGWNEDELQLLAGTQLLTSVQGYRTYFRQRFDELAAGLFAANPDAFPADTFTYEEFVWAVCAVRARVHPPLDGDAIALVPLADTVQHRRAPNVKWALKAAGLFGGGQSLAVEAEVAIAEGVAMAANFGENRTDGQLLLDYGVLDDTAAGPAFALTISLPSDDRFFDDKFDVLETNGYPQAAEFALGRDGRPPPGMLAVLRLVNLAGGDAFLLESIFRADVWEHLQSPVSEGNERAVCSSIIDGCRAALAGYPTTIEDDVAALRSLAPGSRPHAALKVALGEKESLSAALGLFEVRVERLGEMEFYGDRRLKRLGLLDKEGKSTWEGFFEDGIA
jgi:[ribulose-bisphosphate carboxylase]-lysine N-methyltransferase